MADIISLNEKQHATKARQETQARRRKLLAVQKMHQCLHCALKCEKCGMHLHEVPLAKVASTHREKLPYRFCESCAEEFHDYLERLHGRGDDQCYWHNEDWMHHWRSWIDYQGAIDRYVKTKEFLALLREIKEMGSDR